MAINHITYYEISKTMVLILMHPFFQNMLDKPPKIWYPIFQLAEANYSILRGAFMNLSAAKPGEEYIIKDIKTDDEELNSFLFSLGCYSGESIAVISVLPHSLVVSIKDSRYSIDKQLASAILI